MSDVSPHHTQHFCPAGWVELTSQARLAQGRQTISLYCLVLASRGIPYQLRSTSEQRILCVPESWLETARNELETFALEEEAWHNPEPGHVPLRYGRIEPTLWVFFGLFVFHLLTTATVYEGLGHIAWQEWGSAKEWLILQGELWRSGTALTLHADSAHLAGNIGLGALFVALLCREIGSGWGWLIVVGSGMLGNIGNAWISTYGHTAVGASTAVFGAVGAIGGLRAWQGRGNRVVLDSLLPLGAGLGILAMLGTGGGNTDVGAHFWGFGCGVVLGNLFGGALRLSWVPSSRSNRWAGLTAAALIGGSWLLAISTQIS